MNSYNLSLTFESIKIILRMVLDIGIMWMLLYYAIRLVKNNSRTIQIFKGIILILLVNSLSAFLGLTTVSRLAGIFVNWGFLAVIIVFQPEIRSILEKIGKTSVFSRLSSLSGNEKDSLIDSVVTASMLLSRNQTGALITIEQAQSLSDYIATGTKINSVVSAELLTSIFVTSTPLHDGAVIIQGDRIACASAYFPLADLPTPSRYGTRHRAALGISELSDAVTIVISEETGSISITDNGKFIQVNRKELREYLVRIVCGDATEVVVKKEKKKISPVVVEKEDGKGYDDEYLIEPKKKSEVGAKTETSMFSKLAIKRYSDKEDEVVEPDIIEEKKPKRTFGLFGKKKNKKGINTTEQHARILDQEEKNIKLPKKKDNLSPISFDLEKTEAIPKINPDNSFTASQRIRPMGNINNGVKDEYRYDRNVNNRSSITHPLRDSRVDKLDSLDLKRDNKTSISMEFDNFDTRKVRRSRQEIVDDAIEIEGPHKRSSGGKE
ncbi:MAG: diadenylate cyclase CdaA [Anaerorhabdus sp.]